MLNMLNSVPIAATFSKDSSFFGKNFPATYFTEGRGARVKDNTGRWLLDWISGLGATILGHGNVGFEQHVNMFLRKGIAFSMPHELEYKVAEQLTSLLSRHVPGWQSEKLQVRWLLSGSDACNAAVRLARAITGKSKIMDFGYHGWHDTFVGATPPAHGLKQSDVIKFEIGNYEKFNNVNPEEIAAVIMEIGLVSPDTEWYTFIRNWCTKNNVLLIIDEVVTGLRYARGGACELYNIKPDLVCMGKALGNGAPIAALIGKAEHMAWFDPRQRHNNDPVFVSSTNIGNTIGLAAANWMLSYVRDGKYLKHIWDYGELLRNGLSGVGIVVHGNAPRHVIVWQSDGYKAFFINRMHESGILINRPNFVNMAHNLDDIDFTIEVAAQIDNEWSGLTNLNKKVWEDNAPLIMFRNR